MNMVSVVKLYYMILNLQFIIHKHSGLKFIRLMLCNHKKTQTLILHTKRIRRIISYYCRIRFRIA
jgi:hypothetical protein